MGGRNYCDGAMRVVSNVQLARLFWCRHLRRPSPRARVIHDRSEVLLTGSGKHRRRRACLDEFGCSSKGAVVGGLVKLRPMTITCEKETIGAERCRFVGAK